ncbi:Toluene efflux pump outer membrane protein TtgC precursor [compost metagenome]
MLGNEPQVLPAGPLPMVDEGLPAELLSRRPDLRLAELNLRQTLANVDAVRDSYYPTISLTGTLGAASSALGNLIANPAAVLGIGLSLPFLDLEAKRLDTQVARIQYETSVLQFRQTLYQALAEVESALSARLKLVEQVDLLTQIHAAARETERLYEIRYRTGVVALRIWLDAQESQRNAELMLAQAHLNQLKNLSTLYQVFGGDFF